MMRLFHHHEAEPKVTLVDPADAEAYQRSIDQKELAEQLINEKHQQMLLDGVHPWRASDFDQIQLASLAISWASDRTAEILLKEGEVTHANGVTRVSKDVGDFAVAVSQNSLAKLQWARTLKPGQDNVRFGDLDDKGQDRTRNNLQPEAELPYWPQSPDSRMQAEQYWLGDDTESVTVVFLRGIVEAGRNIQAYASSALREEALLPLPPEFVAVPGVFKQILDEAEVGLSVAESFLISGEKTVRAGLGADAYQNAHDGYIAAMLAYTAVVCPQILGPTFKPNR